MSDLPIPPVQLPLIMTAQGPQPLTPAALLTLLISNATSLAPPGYVASLPGTLVEDVASTDVGGCIVSDQARVEAINAVTPFGCNAYILNQLGQMYGVPLGLGSNATVEVVFSGTPGFPIAPGFTVSDGTNTYLVQAPGAIVGAAVYPSTTGSSAPVTALATASGTWPIPAGSVTTIVTGLPADVVLTVVNPLAGTPGTGAQTETSYRSQVLQAGLVSAIGVSRFLKTLLGNVPGVQPQLVAAQAQGNNWEIIVGGGDDYAVAYAVYVALGAGISLLVGSTIEVSGFTQANPGVVSTAPYYHGLTTGASATISQANPSTYDGAYTATVLSPTTFSVGVNTTGYAAYVGGGVLTPNPRNVSVPVSDYPDTYFIPIVRPPQMTVAMTVTWATSLVGFTGAAAIAQLAPPALVAYVNAIPVTQPLNVYLLQETFQQAVASVLPAYYLTVLTFSVSINGVGVSPEVGTGIISGDPESYFNMVVSAVTVVQA
jgi:hypothetical protein